MISSLKEATGAKTGEKNEVQLVVFQLAACELGAPIHQLREIIRVSEMTLMPKAPKFLAGIINLRGRIIPVLDLKKRFDMPLVDKTDETRILVVEIKDQILGLLVDKVVEVLRIDPSQIEPAKEKTLNLGPEFLEGRLVLGSRLILLFRMEKILAMDEAKRLPEFEASSAGEGENLVD